MKLTIVFPVELKKTHLKEGRKHDPDNCPFAMAIRARLPTHCQVMVTCDDVVIYDHSQINATYGPRYTRHAFVISKEMSEAIRNIDFEQRKLVQPGTYYMTTKLELLW